jgi:hypothetical protein
MTSFKTLAALALLSAAASTPVFSRTLERQARHNYVSSGVASHSWCLHNYSADEIDCSYVDRSQCAATAAGGLGQCELKAFEQIACAGLRDTHLRGDCFRRRSEAILGRSCLRRLAFRRMLNSSKGQVSRNVARLDGPVTAPRIDTHYVATEFGVAILLFRSRPISEASGERTGRAKSEPADSSQNRIDVRPRVKLTLS